MKRLPLSARARISLDPPSMAIPITRTGFTPSTGLCCRDGAKRFRADHRRRPYLNSEPGQTRRGQRSMVWWWLALPFTRPGEITAGFVRAMQPWAERAPAIGVDLGGTSIKAGLVSGDGQITMTEKVATRADQGRDAVKASLLEVIGKVVAQASAQGIEPCGLGIASAGGNQHRGWYGFLPRPAICPTGPALICVKLPKNAFIYRRM